MFTDALILAGGSGERLWPLSTKDSPKQFLRFFDDKSFLQETVLRAFSLDLSGKIIIITRQCWIKKIIDDLKSLKDLNKKQFEKIIVIGEPYGKNTAPACALACRLLLNEKNEAPNLIVFPSDHIIQKRQAFISDMETSANVSAKNKIVVFGIKPEAPETGFGYIETEDNYIFENAFNVKSFKEKPDFETAEKYISNGNYFWNSGLYAFKADFYLQELSAFSPLIYKAFDGAFNYDYKSIDGISIIENCGYIEKAYSLSPALSIDYAVSEKSLSTVMIKAGFNWDDAGTWDSLSKYASLSNTAANKNAQNNFVYSDIPVSICGADDLIIVIKNGKALILKKGSGNEVKF